MEAHSLPASEAPVPGRSLPARLTHVRDERLARLVADGNERAFVALYERHAQRLYRYCRSIVGNDADAQDALQGAMASALVALRRGARDAPVRPWLFRIAHNESISLLRRRRPAADPAEAEEASAPSAAEQALERDRLAQLVADLRRLGERQRGALVMRELSGLSHEEIAVALGMSVGAAKQAIFEARGALADFTEGRAMACELVRRAISDGDRRVLRGRRIAAHLRDCEGCATFSAAIPARRDELSALAPPLAPVALAGLLGGIAGVSGAGHGGAAAGALAAGAAGKSAAGALTAKVLVGAVIVGGATVGVTRAVDSAGTGPSHSGRAVTGAAQKPAFTTGAAAGRAGARGGHGAAPGRALAPGETVGGSGAKNGRTGAQHGNHGNRSAGAGDARGRAVRGTGGRHAGASRGQAGSAGGAAHGVRRSSSRKTGTAHGEAGGGPADGRSAAGRSGATRPATPAKPRIAHETGREIGATSP